MSTFGAEQKDAPLSSCSTNIRLGWMSNTQARVYLRGKYHCTIDLLFDWFGLVCFANKNKNRTAHSKAVKQEVNSTEIIAALVFPTLAYFSPLPVTRKKFYNINARCQPLKHFLHCSCHKLVCLSLTRLLNFEWYLRLCVTSHSDTKSTNTPAYFRLGWDKHSSLIRKFVIYEQKRDITLASGWKSLPWTNTLINYKH
jgi:hypothetical protein